MADKETKVEPDKALGVAQPVPAPPPQAVPAVTPEAKPPAADPLACPVCGGTLAVTRHTPDFGTHHTVTCAACGFHEKRAD